MPYKVLSNVLGVMYTELGSSLSGTQIAKNNENIHWICEDIP